MSNDNPGHKPFPRMPLYSAMALIGFAMCAVTVSEVTGVGGTKLAEAKPVTVREFRFVDQADGSVDVIDVPKGKVVQVLEPGTHGFITGVLRVFARERRAASVSTLPPFRLAQLSDGRLAIDDTATGQRIELDAFGSTNVEAFARLLKVGTAVQ